ncbi:MAG: hypothetical protein IJA14_01140, partial [Alphaproteobacteria bacterium]|nr:hypothetical protein [Alphaproteobacteria bacterium]
MVNETTNNKNYPLPHPSNIASQDVTRIATALTMIDADISECSSSINSINNTVQNLDAKSLRIPSELVGQVNTELTNIQPRRYVVVNEDASGFSTVEGGGGEGGKKGEILVKKSDANFDTTWLDPRAILKKAPTVKEVVSDVQLQNNGTTILAEVQETDLRDDTPRHGLTQRQITSDTTADSSYTYILCDTIDDTAEDESDIATHEKFGRVKIGSGINVNNGEISVPVIGVASENNFGLVKIGSGLNVNNGVVSAQTYPHADHENFGIIKPSEDFNFDSNGALQVAKKSEYIIYQKAAKNIVEDGVIKIVPTCAYYRAFINTDTLFSFDWSNFAPKSDISFDLEIVSDGNYIVNFGNNVAWKNPCAAVTVGTTLIHFEKMLGNSIMIGNLISTGTPPLTKILNDSNLIDDVSDICICKHNGTSRGDREAYDLGVGRNFWHNYMFTNPEGGIFEFDLLKSTYVPYAHFDLDGGTLAYFYVEGSVDGNNWRRLLTLTNVSTSGDKVLDSCGFFRYYRILTKGAYFLNLRLIGYSIDDNLFELKKLIPSMTSNEENGYAITSTTLNSGALSNLTGVSRTSYADFTTRDNGEFWIKYELPEAESVDMIDLMASADSSEKMPNWFKIEGSNNDSDWTLLIERAYLTRWYEGESRQYWINNSTAYKYYKFTPIETSSSGFRIARFRLYKKIDGILSSKGFIPSLTSTSQGGYEVSA